MNFEKIIAVRTGKTIYQDGNKAVKVFDKDYSKADVLNEALNQARVEETGLLIPKVLEVSMQDSKWAITSEFISGKTMAQLMQENPDKTDEYISKFIDLQIKIHSMKAPQLNKLKDKMSVKICQADIDATTRYDLHTRLEGMPKHMKVCHGDFNPTNIIITSENKPYILDWSHATQGNASADVAITYLYFCLHNDKKIADKYLDLFCAKSKTHKKYIQTWLPIAAASQSVKGNPEEREFLLNWVNVVDYE